MSASYVAASLANFYGERELEIHAWDEDKERCDAMCRVMRLFFRANRIRHVVYARESKEAALANMNGAIICGNETLPLTSLVIPTFQVKGAEWWSFVPGQEPTLDNQKFQVLRWINKEEYPSTFLYQNRENPLVKWLNDL